MTLDEFFRHVGQSNGLLVTVGVSFLAGIVASAVCPCTLPVGIGIASVASASETAEQRSGIKIAAAFFAGIVINLALLGVIAGRLGTLATESFGRNWALVMAVVSLLAAGVAFWGPRLRPSQLAALRRPGLTGAFGYGFIFSLGTSVAPLLLLLAFSAASAHPGHGFLLALAFGIGRGAPFLLIGLLAGFAVRFTQLTQWRRTLQVMSGCALLVLAGYYGQTFMALR